MTSREEPEITALSKRALWTVMLAFTLLCCFAIVTAICWFLQRHAIAGVHWASQEHAYHPQLGWTAHPGYVNEHNRHVDFPFDVSVKVNSSGFRDEEWSAKARLGGRKILVIGDSYIYGWATYTDDLFTHIAETIARDHGNDVVFYNGGINGYGFQHYHREIGLLAGEIKPDEIWVMLTPNDVGDTALPYDHRYVQRVYKPFYDENGRLWNEVIPERLSLTLRDTTIGKWPGWLFIDELQYLGQDARYFSSGLPTRFTSPLPITQYDELINNRTALDRYPAIERMVRRNISDIVKLSEAGNFKVRFINNVANQNFDKYFDDIRPMYDPGAAAMRTLDPWLAHINEAHPGILWAIMLAARAQNLSLSSPDEKLEALIAQKIPAAFDFDAEVPASHALSGMDWGVTPDRKLYLKANKPGFLKLYAGSATGDGKTRLTLRMKSAVPASAIKVSDLSGACERLGKGDAEVMAVDFVCASARHADVPALRFFRLDADRDIRFERAELAPDESR
mgnify:CR=1 FL=1